MDEIPTENWGRSRSSLIVKGKFVFLSGDTLHRLVVGGIVIESTKSSIQNVFGS
jgi:hypothetical protein